MQRAEYQCYTQPQSNLSQHEKPQRHRSSKKVLQRTGWCQFHHTTKGHAATLLLNQQIKAQHDCASLPDPRQQIYLGTYWGAQMTRPTTGPQLQQYPALGGCAYQ
jgi:hypothetical protein